MPKLIDLTNKQFGKLTVIKRNEYNDSTPYTHYNEICIEDLDINTTKYRVV